MFGLLACVNEHRRVLGIQLFVSAPPVEERGFR